MDHDRLIAEIPDARPEDSVTWLVMVHDPKTDGWFLYGHRKLKDPSEFDFWFPSRDDAFSQATNWGVQASHWHKSPT